MLLQCTASHKESGYFSSAAVKKAELQCFCGYSDFCKNGHNVL